MASFWAIAQDTGCKCVDAAETIRRRAIGKRNEASSDGGDERRDSAVLDDDKHLLFTRNSLCKAIGNFDAIYSLLQCRCPKLCGLQWSHCSPQEDRILAQTITNQIATQTWKLGAIAVLVLSGCLFSLRALHVSDSGSLEQYGKALRDEENNSYSFEDPDPEGHPEGELRSNLFQALLRDQTWSDQTLQTMTHKFLESIKNQLWLVRIPAFDVSNELRKLHMKMNLPFLDEKQDFQAPLGRRYLHFKFAEEYLPVGLENRRYFRKELNFSHDDKRWRYEANHEVEMLKLINGLKHRNIARMLFAFEEWSAPRYLVSIVFDYHQHNLAAILHESSKDARAADLLHHFGDSAQPDWRLDHKLWKAILEIVDAVKCLHEFRNEGIRAQADIVVHAGHFDIKPANILIDLRRPQEPRLLLTDFGRAYIRRTSIGQSSGHAGTAATFDYAPPEALGHDEQTTIRRSYDIWSLGCVLLETLIQVVQMYRDSYDFYCDRFRDSPAGNENAAFWIRNASGQPVLGPSVERRLASLDSSQQPRLVQASACIRRMLSVNYRQRPKLSLCLEDFQTADTPDPHDWIGEHQRRIMEDKLSQMATSCWKTGFGRSFGCALFYWRDRNPHSKEKVTMLVQRPAADVVIDHALLSTESISPVSFFDERAVFAKKSTSTSALRCAFSNLHSGLNLIFQDGNEFRDFFAAMTYQRILPRASLGFPFSSCQLHIRKMLGSKVESFSAGRVQLWNTYSEQEYNEKFDINLAPLRSTSTSRSLISFEKDRSDIGSTPVNETHHIPDSLRNRFKLAIFVYDHSDKTPGQLSRPICIIVELGNDNIEMDRTTQNSAHVVFKKTGSHASFPVGIFEPTVEVKASGGDQARRYPAIPMSPATLSENIHESKYSLKKLDLGFADHSEHKSFWQLLAAMNVQ